MLKGNKVGGLADEDQNQLVNIPSPISHTKFYSRDWLTQSIIYWWRIIRRGEGELIEDLRYCYITLTTLFQKPHKQYFWFTNVAQKERVKFSNKRDSKTSKACVKTQSAFTLVHPAEKSECHAQRKVCTKMQWEDVHFAARWKCVICMNKQHIKALWVTNFKRWTKKAKTQHHIYLRFIPRFVLLPSIIKTADLSAELLGITCHMPQ